MRRHEGFTLLEMLVAIITLGILSTVITLSVKTMSTTADANNIINNMIMLRHATLIWYKENLSRMVIDSKGGCKINVNGVEQTFNEYVDNNSADILRYLDNKNTLILRSGIRKDPNNTGDYTLQSVNDNKQWYVCYNSGTTSWTISNYGEESPILDIKQKLEGRASGLGLEGKNDITSNKLLGTYNANDHKFACMLIMDFSK